MPAIVRLVTGIFLMVGRTSADFWFLEFARWIDTSEVLGLHLQWILINLETQILYNLWNDEKSFILGTALEGMFVVDSSWLNSTTDANVGKKCFLTET